ncbi:hypothetical protein [Zhihengliuella sp.]|uniref:hypothetical protein n=1 Tax=Zhihengliuella sp. TaxID=1954483 RepID=UPI0028120174|nr:hypothetical protein [Zhihengliuella sp.]
MSQQNTISRVGFIHAIGALIAYAIWLIEFQSIRPTVFSLTGWWPLLMGVSVAVSALLLLYINGSKKARIGALGSLLIAALCGVFEAGGFVVYSAFFGLSLILWAFLFRSALLAIAAVFNFGAPSAAFWLSHEPVLALQLGILAPLSLILATFLSRYLGAGTRTGDSRGMSSFPDGTKAGSVQRVRTDH